MRGGWESRCHTYYSSRYDHRRNLADWDYCMRLSERGNPGQDPKLGSIIHAQQFRTWRETGIAYQVRDSRYTEANCSLISTAVGRAKEFKDRNGEDRGRSVAARGYWGDILNSPYHSFGTVSREASLFERSSFQFVKTAVDVAQYNVMCMLHELTEGQPYRHPSERETLLAESAEDDSSTLRQGEVESDEAVTPEVDKKENISALGRQGSGEERCERGASSGGSTTGAQIPAVPGPSGDFFEVSEAAARALSQTRVAFCTGDLAKALKRRKGPPFSVITLGYRHVHLLHPDHGLYDAAADGAVLLVESCTYMLQLTHAQVAKFEEMVKEEAIAAGWTAGGAGSLPDLPPGVLLFHKGSNIVRSDNDIGSSGHTGNTDCSTCNSDGNAGEIYGIASKCDGNSGKSDGPTGSTAGNAGHIGGNSGNDDGITENSDGHTGSTSGNTSNSSGNAGNSDDNIGGKDGSIDQQVAPGA
eukprot:jgi/Botrbrau1/8724/Bobra.0311s0034.1